MRSGAKIKKGVDGISVHKIGGKVTSSRVRLTTVARAIKRQRGKRVLVVSAPAGATSILRELVAFLQSHAAQAQEDAASKIGAFAERMTVLYHTWLDGLDLPRHKEEIDRQIASWFMEKAQAAATIKVYTAEFADGLLSLGELMAVSVVESFLKREGVSAEVVDVSKRGMLTDDAFGKARPLGKAGELLRQALRPVIGRGMVAVVPGFVGHTEGGKITTLGRSASDYTATEIARALGAALVTIWKEFEICSSDPAIVGEDEVVPIHLLSFSQTAELAEAKLGALHPAAMEPLRGTKTKVHVRNVDDSGSRGTWIIPGTEGSRVPAGITLMTGQVLMTVATGRMVGVTGVLAHGSGLMAAAQGDIETTASGQTCFSLSATIPDHSINGVVTQMGAIGSVKTQRGSSVVTIVGSRRGITALTFEKIIGALRMKRIRIRAFSMPGVLTDANQGASSLSCQVVVADEQGKDAVRAIHRALYGQPKKRRRV